MCYPDVVLFKYHVLFDTLSSTDAFKLDILYVKR